MLNLICALNVLAMRNLNIVMLHVSIGRQNIVNRAYKCMKLTYRDTTGLKGFRAEVLISASWSDILETVGLAQIIFSSYWG